jgi:zinc and cadmium transporter
VKLGIVTALAVMAHEIPQEIGDFAVLLHSRMSRGRALALNLMSSLTSVIGGVVAYFTLGDALRMLPYAIAVAAASFIYVSMSDLIPGLHRRISTRDSVAQVILISLGIAVIAVVERHVH